MMPTFDDPVTPSDEARRVESEAQDEHYREFEQREQDNLELLAEIDTLRRQAEEAAAELKKMRDQRDALARYIELIADPMHAPSRPKDRPRYAFESHADYELRGE